MSERGSFVTEYVYCPDCFNGLKKILLSKHKFLCSRVVRGWESKNSNLPIIAGKIGGLFSGEEIITFDVYMRKSIESSICHSIRIAVIAEDGFELLEFKPK